MRRGDAERVLKVQQPDELVWVPPEVLPETLYHGTTQRGAARIMEEGLLPPCEHRGMCPWHGKESSDDYTSYDSLIYFTPDRDAAAKWARSGATRLALAEVGHDIRRESSLNLAYYSTYEPDQEKQLRAAKVLEEKYVPYVCKIPKQAITKKCAVYVDPNFDDPQIEQEVFNENPFEETYEYVSPCSVPAKVIQCEPEGSEMPLPRLLREKKAREERAARRVKLVEDFKRENGREPTFSEMLRMD